MPHEIDDIVLVFGVCGRRDARRLIQYDVYQLLPGIQWLSVDGYLIARTDPVALLGHFTVETNTAGLDPPVGFAAGTKARLGDELVQRDGWISQSKWST